MIPEDSVGKIVEENIGITVIEMIATTEAGIGLEKDHFSGDYGGNRTRSTSNSRSRSGSTASTNKDRITFYNCREYDHFVRDYPSSREERDIDQLQQMLNLEEEQTHLLTNAQNSTAEKSQTKSFKLMNGRDGTSAFLPLDSKIGGHINYNSSNVGQFLTSRIS